MQEEKNYIIFKFTVTSRVTLLNLIALDNSCICCCWENPQFIFNSILITKVDDSSVISTTMQAIILVFHQMDPFSHIRYLLKILRIITETLHGWIILMQNTTVLFVSLRCLCNPHRGGLGRSRRTSLQTTILTHKQMSITFTIKRAVIIFPSFDDHNYHPFPRSPWLRSTTSRAMGKIWPCLRQT